LAKIMGSFPALAMLASCGEFAPVVLNGDAVFIDESEPVFSQCMNGDGAVAGGTFEIDGLFEIVVSTSQGIGPYTLNVMVEPIGTASQQAGLGVVLTALGADSIADTDFDGIPDKSDNCRGIANSDQADVDENGTGDACDSGTNPGIGRISGSLSIIEEAGIQTVIEREPNNSSDQSQFVGQVAAGESFSILGTIEESVGGPDLDSFRFSPTGPVRVRLSLEGAGSVTEDVAFDVGVVDFERQSCKFEPTSTGEARVYHLPSGDFPPSQVVIGFDSEVSTANREAIMRRAGVTCTDMSPSNVAQGVCSLDSSWDAKRCRLETYCAAASLRGIDGVKFAEPAYILSTSAIPDDPLFNLQWHLPLIGLPDAWDVTVGSEKVIVAVVDTGILLDHPDLSGRLVTGFDFISQNFFSLDGDGRDADPNDPGDAPAAPGGSSFHGTHVAGTIAAATDNSAGVAGVSWNSRIMPLRALGLSGNGLATDIAEAILYAAGLPNASDTLPDEPAQIINMSLGGPAGSAPPTVVREALRQAVDAGVTVFAAAGNEASGESAFPGGFEETISVGAVDLGLNLANYSNFGPTIDLVAPGGDLGQDRDGDNNPDGVLSTIGQDITGDVTFQFAFQNGTSMACPQVAGVAALMLSVNPDLRPDDIRQLLTDNAVDIGIRGRDDFFGAGLVNAPAAVRAAQRFAGQEPKPTPPNLGLSTNSVDFGASEERFSVAVTNTGDGVLLLNDVEVVELDAGGWLTVEIADRNVENSSTSMVEIRIDRGQLGPGSYRGLITVTSNAATEVINVLMRVRAKEAITDRVFVIAVSPQSLGTIGQDITDASKGFAYTIDGLPAGEYLIFAGTDRDGDGFICEPGDLCGSQPSVIAPRLIPVEGGSDSNQDSFGVVELIFTPPAPYLP
jgi:serine protease